MTSFSDFGGLSYCFVGSITCFVLQKPLFDYNSCDVANGVYQGKGKKKVQGAIALFSMIISQLSY